jgi:hypothetical protein
LFQPSTPRQLLELEYVLSLKLIDQQLGTLLAASDAPASADGVVGGGGGVVVGGGGGVTITLGGPESRPGGGAISSGIFTPQDAPRH